MAGASSRRASGQAAGRAGPRAAVFGGRSRGSSNHADRGLGAEPDNAGTNGESVWMAGVWVPVGLPSANLLVVRYLPAVAQQHTSVEAARECSVMGRYHEREPVLPLQRE